MKTELNESTVVASRSETRAGLWQQYEKLFRSKILCGSVAYKIVHTASGKSDLFVSLRSKNEWDICACDLIIQNAGGILIDRNLKPIQYNSPNPHIPNGLIAGPPQLVEKAKPIFKINKL